MLSAADSHSSHGVRVPGSSGSLHRAGENRRESRHQRERLVRERVPPARGRPRGWPLLAREVLKVASLGTASQIGRTCDEGGLYWLEVLKVASSRTASQNGKTCHEGGLYWLLCALHRVIFVTGTTISQEVIDGVMSIRVLEVDRNALRHSRDYLVLRQLERLLERLSIEFATLRDLRPSF